MSLAAMHFHYLPLLWTLRRLRSGRLSRLEPVRGMPAMLFDLLRCWFFLKICEYDSYCIVVSVLTWVGPVGYSGSASLQFQPSINVLLQ
jgi:hypothetical protein